MASLIDSGDGLHPANLSGTYTLDVNDLTLTVGADGVADSGYILPNDSQWLLTEVFDVEGVQYDLGLTTFNDDLATMVVDMEALRQEAILAYTTFKMVASHYKTGDLVDIYQGDESNPMFLKTINTDLCMTPSTVSWKITRDLLSKWYKGVLWPKTSLYPSTSLWPSGMPPPLYTSDTLYPDCGLYPS